jgi:hypothetical protein
MSKKSHVLSLFVLIIASFVFGRSTYVEYLSWYYGSDHLIFSQTIAHYYLVYLTDFTSRYHQALFMRYSIY